MSGGKIGAQAAHAETLAAHDYFMPETGTQLSWLDNQRDLYNKWYGDGHYAKYVMEAESGEQLQVIERYLKERGFKTYLVIDEGHTEGTYFVPTAMAVELVDKDDDRVRSIFGEFKLYKDPKPEPITDHIGPWGINMLMHDQANTASIPVHLAKNLHGPDAEDEYFWNADNTISTWTPIKTQKPYSWRLVDAKRNKS